MLLPPLQVRQVLLSFFRLPPNLIVQKTHHRHWHIERGDGRPERNELVRLYELDVALVLGHLAFAVDVRPRVDPRRPQDKAEAPRTAYHDRGAPGSPLGAVRERARHTEVPIETDYEQVEHRRVGGEVVQREPRVAHVRPQRPVPVDREHGEQGHGDEPDREVGHRQREQEVVADGLQLLVDLEGDHDHGVAHHGEHGEHAGDDGDDDLLDEAEGAGGQVGAERQV